MSDTEMQKEQATEEPREGVQEPEDLDRILVVSRDGALREQAAHELDGDEREVLAVDGPAEASQLLKAQHIALFLLDAGIGLDQASMLLESLRETRGASTAPVIVLASEGQRQAHSNLLNDGADQVLEKPVEPELLRASVFSKLRRAAEIRRESRHDPLTGLPNRAAFAEAYDRALALARRNDEPLSVAILDLDLFKSINDRFGHGQGDEVLRRVAEIASEVLRKSDMMARWGGEEFVVLLPNTDPAGAIRALENVQDRVRDETWRTPNGEVFKITFSAGIADASSGAPLPEVVARADYYLYLAKATGRDRIISEHSRVDAPSRRILLAESDELTASLIRHRLSREGFEVVHHTDSIQASKVTAEPPIAMAILDVTREEFDGFGLLRTLRGRRDFAGVPILVLTEVGSESAVVKGKELGADDYVVKPFSPVELVARIQRHLGARSEEEQGGGA